MTPAQALPIRRAALWGALAMCLLMGCSSVKSTRRLPWQKMPLDASTGFYQSATLEYRVDAGKLQQPLDAARVQGQHLWYEQVASSPLPDESTGTLTITYPHPSGRSDVAQVKFVLESRPAEQSSTKSLNPLARIWPGDDQNKATRISTSQPELHETWVMDITSAESDGYFKVLGAQSFYDTQRPEVGPTQVAMTINGKRIEKNWDSIPQLNLLVQRVRREGQLAAYARPGVLVGRQPQAITSVRAYGDVMAQVGGPVAASPADLALHPFSMAPPPAAVAPAPAPQMARTPGLSR